MSIAHPEKELFESVLKLKDSIQNIKERVLKLENEYLTKIEQTESRYIHNKQVDQKINSLKKSKKVFLKYGENIYPFSIDSIENNLFTSKKLIKYFTEGFENGIKEVDIKPLYLDYIREIILYGNEEFDNVFQACSFEDYSSINFYDDKVFISLLATIFDFDILNQYFNFKIENLPKKDEDIILRIEVDKADDGIKLVNIRSNESELTNRNNINRKGLFMKANGKVTLYLKKKVKTQKVYFRVFSNSNLFKNGKTPFKIQTSADNGLSYTNEISITTNENLIEVVFLNIVSFNSITFTSTSAFSITYFTFHKDD